MTQYFLYGPVDPGHSEAPHLISSVLSAVSPLSQLVHLCLFTTHALLTSRKDPRRLDSHSHEAVRVVYLAINHGPPCDKSSVALNCYVNLVLDLAFSGQKLLIVRENHLATLEAEQREYPVSVRALAAGAGNGGLVRRARRTCKSYRSVSCHLRPDNGPREEKHLFYSHHDVKKQGPPGES